MPALLAIRDGVVINACPRLFGLAAKNGDGEIVRFAIDMFGALEAQYVLATALATIMDRTDFP